MEEEVLYNNSFFKDEASEYIFYLLHTDAKNRADLLGITLELYYDKAKAIEWHNNIYNAIIRHEDKELVSKAVNKLEELFARLMKAYEYEEE